MPDRKELSVDQAVLVLAMLDNQATPEQIAELDELLRAQPRLVSSVVDMISQEAYLAWTCSLDVSSLPDPVEDFRSSPGLSLLLDGDAPCPPQQNSLDAAASFLQSSWLRMAAAAMVLIAVSAVIGGAAMQAYDGYILKTRMNQLPQLMVAGSEYSALLVESSACRWGPGARTALKADSTLRQGEAINLLEGIARFRMDRPTGTAYLIIEGPAGLVLTADGGCSISHGLVSANVNSLAENLVIDTPSCQLNILPTDAAIGISVDGHDVSVHLFDGEARVMVPWGAGQLDSQYCELEAGESLDIHRESNGKLVVSRGFSEPDRFASRTSMKSNHLVVPASYPEAVLSKKPLLYWRFDELTSQQIPNQAGEKYAGLVHGKLAWHQAANNGYADFTGGVSEEELSAHIMASEPIDFGSSNAYSLELWMKPSHCHHCSLAAMFVHDHDTHAQKHGLLVELGGPTALQYSLVEPGKVRFLHRSPAGSDVSSGSSCFSSSYYDVRKWQHVVAVKSPEQLRLFVDGRLVGARDDESQIANGLRLVLGQLDNRRYMRRFVGQMDEVALYPIALGEDEVQEHYNLINNAPPQPRMPITPSVSIGNDDI